MQDLALLQLRLDELEESIGRLRFTLKSIYEENAALKQVLRDIAGQSGDSNEKTLAKLCLEELNLR